MRVAAHEDRRGGLVDLEGFLRRDRQRLRGSRPPRAPWSAAPPARPRGCSGSPAARPAGAASRSGSSGRRRSAALRPPSASFIMSILAASTVRGVRSWCAALAVNSRCCCMPSSSRSSALLTAPTSGKISCGTPDFGSRMLELPGLILARQGRQLLEREQTPAHRQDADPELGQQEDDDEPAAVGDELVEDGGIDGLEPRRDLLDLRGECPLAESSSRSRSPRCGCRRCSARSCDAAPLARRDEQRERTDAAAGGRHDASAVVANRVTVAALDAVIGFRQARRQVEHDRAVLADGDEIRDLARLLHQGALLEVALRHGWP